MLYHAFDMQKALLAGAGRWADASARILASKALPFAYFGGGPVLASALEVFAHAVEPRGKPAFGLDATIIDGKSVRVREQVVVEKPFGNLLRFVREGREGDPKLLIVAPMWAITPPCCAERLNGCCRRMMCTSLTGRMRKWFRVPQAASISMIMSIM